MTVKIKYYFKSDETIDKVWRNEKGELHREDGPAVESSNGRREWFKNGLRHREDGPAIVWEDGTHSYYLNDIKYTKEEYWKKIEKIKKRRESKIK